MDTNKKINAAVILMWAPIVCSVLLILSTFFTFLSINALGMTESAKLIDGVDGIIVIVVAVVALVMSLLGRGRWTANQTVIAMGIVSLAIMFFEIYNMNEELASMGISMSDLKALGITMHYGFGFYLMLISSIGILACGVIYTVMNYGISGLFKRPKR